MLVSIDGKRPSHSLCDEYLVVDVVEAWPLAEVVLGQAPRESSKRSFASSIGHLRRSASRVCLAR